MKPSTINVSLLHKSDYEQLSSCVITSSDLPILQSACMENTLYDQAMGPLFPFQFCRTCKQVWKSCMGHPGLINLPVMMYNPIQLPHLLTLLNSSCQQCVKLNLRSQEKEKYASQLESLLSKDLRAYFGKFKSEVKQIPDYTPDLVNQLKREILGHLLSKKFCACNCASNALLNNNMIYLNSQFAFPQNIHKFTVNLLINEPFLNHFFSPDQFFLSSVLAVPTKIRPPKLENGFLKHHQVTRNLQQIIIQAEKLKQTDQITVFEDIQTLQVKINEYVNESQQSLLENISGKEGLIRNNVQGKRVNFTARSVISPDINVKSGEIGLSAQYLEQLTVPEIVNKFNVNLLRQLILNGTKYPGAVKVETEGKTIYLARLQQPELQKIANGLLYGDSTVYRHLLENDKVMLNRQPTLHKNSMLAHKIKLIPGNSTTFRISYQDCLGYNADFDGDEMTIHVPQSIEATQELELMSARTNLISQGSGQLVRGVIQDTVLGSGIICTKLFNCEKFNQFLWCAIGAQKEQTRVEFIQSYSQKGGQCFNDTFKCMGGIEEYKRMQKQKLQNKQVVKKIVEHDEMLYKIPQPAIIFPQPVYTGKQLITAIISKVSKRVNYKSKNISVLNSELCRGDLTGDELSPGKFNLISAIHDVSGSNEASNMLDHLSKLVQFYFQSRGFSFDASDLIINSKNKQKISAFKFQFNLILKGSENIMKSINKFERSLIVNPPSSNNLYKMIKTGSKGNQLNFKQITLCVGMQQPKLNVKNLTLEKFGYVRGSYSSSLSPREFFSHHVAGRAALVVQTISTQHSGCISRNLIKSLENYFVQYDGSVRDQNGFMLQPYYGGDGIEVTKREALNQFEHVSTNRKMLKSKKTGAHAWLVELHMTYNILKNKEQQDNQESAIKKMFLLTRKLNMSHMLSKFTVESAQDNLPYFCRALKTIKSTVRRYPIQSIINPYFNQGVWSNSYKARSLQYALSAKKNYETLYSLMHHKYKSSLVEPGEMVGVHAGQAVGEPATQMTLNSFHEIQMNEAMGIEQLERIIYNVAVDEHCSARYQSQEAAQYLMRRLDKVPLSRLVKGQRFEKYATQIKIVLTLVPDTYKYSEEYIDNALKDFVTNLIIQIQTENGYYWKHGTFVQQEVSVISQNKRFSEFTAILKIPCTYVCFQSFVDSVMQSTYLSNLELSCYLADNRIHLSGKHALEMMKQIKGSFIDQSSIQSDSAKVTQQLYGIETAQAFIVQKLQNIFANNKLLINESHLQLIADFMTKSGEVIGMKFKGIQYTDDVVQKICYQQPAKVLQNIGSNNIISKIGTSAGVVCGSGVGGTSSFKLLAKIK
ncbi:DNA-directed_RNA polymerase subunit [Hexamita inflata]|uniref:DNA-directed RNA polymerase subunit n=1 Tax=Hexamita inflata TaxID=28002 RepID=A0AA86TY31_9EUKA|nr:DNA-directed RNA polymerase subunit [Hexamita inflata]